MVPALLEPFHRAGVLIEGRLGEFQRRKFKGYDVILIIEYEVPVVVQGLLNGNCSVFDSDRKKCYRRNISAVDDILRQEAVKSFLASEKEFPFLAPEI